MKTCPLCKNSSSYNFVNVKNALVSVSVLGSDHERERERERERSLR